MRIPADHGHLEANLRRPEGEPLGAAVVAHPHPQHGGTMHTKAVFRTAQALNEAGMSALRFNFRGVGTSTGSYDEGRGEQDDVRSALAYLEREAPGLPLVVAGFSFGSMVGLRVAAGDRRAGAMVGLGLPVTMYDFGFLEGLDRPLLVIQGEEDQFGPAGKARAILEPLSPWIRVESIGGSGHFFEGHFEELKDRIREFLLRGAGAEALADARGVTG